MTTNPVRSLLPRFAARYHADVGRRLRSDRAAARRDIPIPTRSRCSNSSRRSSIRSSPGIRRRSSRATRAAGLPAAAAAGYPPPQQYPAAAGLSAAAATRVSAHSRATRRRATRRPVTAAAGLWAASAARLPATAARVTTGCCCRATSGSTRSWDREARAIDPGLRLGGLIGFYASPVFSINGELSIDFMNLNNDNSFTGDITAVRAALSLSPLYHVATSGNFEVVLGPKLGVWDEEYDDSSGNKLVSLSGYLVGINAGGFTRVGNTLLGGLFSFENSVIDKACQPDSFGNDQCNSVSGGPSHKVLAFNLSALF